MLPLEMWQNTEIGKRRLERKARLRESLGVTEKTGIRRRGRAPRSQLFPSVPVRVHPVAGDATTPNTPRVTFLRPQTRLRPSHHLIAPLPWTRPLHVSLPPLTVIMHTPVYLFSCQRPLRSSPRSLRAPRPWAMLPPGGPTLTA